MTIPTINHSFVGQRQDGINPPADAKCQVEGCGYPRNQHIDRCPGVLNISGRHYTCDLVPPHHGWGHQNREAEAVWGIGKHTPAE